MTTALVVLAILVLVAVGFGAWIMFERQRTESLRERFGPEYGRALHTAGDRSKGESELQRRQSRVEALQIQPLADEDIEHYRQEWQAVQQRFVDAPDSAIADADSLVREVMQHRGYPISDFDQRAADLSVDHPRVVSNYRAAHEISLRHERGEATTDQMRAAMLNYRALFDDLLKSEVPKESQQQRRAS